MAKKKKITVKYVFTGIVPGKYHFADFGEIDLVALTEEQQAELHSRGFPFIVKQKF